MDDGLACFVAVVRGTSLARCDRRVVNQLQKVLSEPGDNGNLLAVLAQGVELVRVCSFYLLTGDIRQLCFGDEGFGFGADKLLFENDDLGRVRLLVFQLGNLVGDLLFPCTTCQSLGAERCNLSCLSVLTVSTGLNRCFNISNALHGDAVLVVTINILIFELADFVEKNTQFVGNIGNIFITRFAPERELLL